MSLPKFNLKACRVNKGYTLCQVSKMLGISPSTLCYWENYKTKLKPYELEKLSEVYEVEIRFIFLPYNLDLNE